MIDFVDGCPTPALVRLQQLDKIIMQHFFDFCREHGLSGFLVAGSALGAIRHRDIIPWDDDIDVGLIREDYDRFMKLYRNDPASEIYLESADNGDAYYLAFAKLRYRPSTIDEPLFEGITDALSTLVEDGWLLGVATGKSDRGLALCLDHHGIGRHFVTLQTADRHPSKPHPSMIQQAMAEAGAAPETTMMIGDTAYDIGMARAAGVTAVGVAWGYHDETELFAEGAHHVARVPRDIVTIARGLP